MEANKIKTHIDTLRLLLSAQRGLDKARASNSSLRPRTGIRGGRATTLEARHSTAAEHRDKMEARALCEAEDLWGMQTR